LTFVNEDATHTDERPKTLAPAIPLPGIVGEEDFHPRITLDGSAQMPALAACSWHHAVRLN